MCSIQMRLLNTRMFIIADKNAERFDFPDPEQKFVGSHYSRYVYAGSAGNSRSSHGLSEVIDENFDMVQKIAFLLGEGAAKTEQMLNSVIESHQSPSQNKAQVHWMDEKYYIEVNCQQKSHFEARVCGDVFLSKRIKEEGRIIAVLSDGMGHGIKANILATLTSTLALNLTQEHRSCSEAGRDHHGYPAC